MKSEHWRSLILTAALCLSLTVVGKLKYRRYSTGLVSPSSSKPLVFQPAAQSQCSSLHNTSNTSERLLVVIYGLMRTYESTWPQIRSGLSLYESEILVSTNLQHQCKEKVCPGNTPAESEKKFREKIQNAYGDATIIQFRNDTRSVGRILLVIRARSQQLNMTMMNYLNQFDFVLALRPDAVFTTPTSFLCLREICMDHTGFNIISGDFERDCFWHKRDWDFGFLACKPQSLPLYFEPVFTCQRDWPGCSASVPIIPPLPSDFTGSWYDTCYSPRPLMNQSALDSSLCRHSYCDIVATFRTSNVRLGTLDNVTFLRLIREGQ